MSKEDEQKFTLMREVVEAANYYLSQKVDPYNVNYNEARKDLSIALFKIESLNSEDK